MSDQFTIRFPFFSLDTFDLSIAGQQYTFIVQINTHGVVFKTYYSIVDETGMSHQRVLYFTEGSFLGFADVDQAILVELEGTEQDVNNFWTLYNNKLASALPGLFVDESTNHGFIRTEYERLQKEDVGI